MKKQWIFFILIGTLLHAQSPAELYVKRFAKTAIDEMEKYSIPASITLAQGMLESSYGGSDLTNRSNNHFGIKCHSSWTGERVYHDDDARGECFRKYSSPWFSFRDHSKFLQKKRYQHLYTYDSKDYKSWAKGLKKAGYATNPKYPELLISKIEKYQLWRYDYMTSQTVDKELSGALAVAFSGQKIDSPAIAANPSPAVTQPSNSTHQIYKHRTGKLPYIIAQQGDTWDNIAAEFDIKIKKIVAYNDVALDRSVTPGQYVFLKKKKSRAKEKYHTVRQEEDMYQIAQKYGVRLGKLYEKNLMRIGEQPKAGDVISLKRKKRIKK
ncbi:MAG: glucosaminidase domain-containing protein [Flavobacteriales bacterium]